MKNTKKNSVLKKPDDQNNSETLKEPVNHGPKDDGQSPEPSTGRPSVDEKDNDLQEELTNKRAKKEVMRIAWPVLLELFLSSLFGMVDMIMLGNIRPISLSAASIASVGITNQPLFIALSLVQSFNVGGTAIIARYYGMGRMKKMGNVLKHILILSVTFIIIPLFLLSMFQAENIMRLLGAGEDVVAIGSGYYRVIHIGLIFQGINMSFAAALRGVGETKVPMKINLFANGMNVIGNAVLIYGLFGFPALGVLGAGISTALSQVIAAALLVSYVLRGKSTISLKGKFSFEKTTIRNLINIGLPASFEQLALRAGIFVFVRIVASLGTVVYAAHQIALSILGLSFNPGQAFGISASTLVGRSLGEGSSQKAEIYARNARRIGSIISSFIAVLFFVFAPQIVGLYTPDQQIIDSASSALRIIALVQPFQSSQLILAGALRGAGDTLWPLIATIIGVIGIRISMATLLVTYLNMGLDGAWYAVLVDQLVRWYMIHRRFNSGKWKMVKIH